MEQTYLGLASQGVKTALMMAAIPLACSLAVGFMVSIFQAVTSIQEQTLTFVPKIFVTGIVLTLAGPKMLNLMETFSTGVFGNLHNYVR